MTDIVISFGKNGIGQFQASINAVDEKGWGYGYRIFGGKYDGMGTEIARHTLTKRDVREIRRYLDMADETPPQQG